tara:strand:+ start:5558 stop:5827 length:270 start_codon:yes stop_codon:yes gene_type:complete
MIPIEGSVLVDFYADWCMPCKRMDPVLNEFKNSSDVKVVKINIDKHRDLALDYGVRSVPCFVFIQNGQEKNRKFGYMPLESLIRMTKGD